VQPDLSLAFPDAAVGARDQTFRLMVRPSFWGRTARIRLTNAFGTRPVTIDGVHLGVQESAAALLLGSNRAVHFGGSDAVTIEPGAWTWSDAVDLGTIGGPEVARLETGGIFDGRRLAVSLHVAGQSGPMTWHAKALTTSYVTAPGAGATGGIEDESAFPFTTTSWFFVDAVDMLAPVATRLLVAFGDSITDGTASTLNGDDRWPDALARRLRASGLRQWSVVNAGIGGNQVTAPAVYGAARPVPGGPSALQRLERDVLSLSAVSAVAWLEGINDLSRNGTGLAADVESGMREGVRRIRAAIPGVRVFGATVVSALGSRIAAHGSPEQDAERQRLNAFIRTSGVFDAVLDFDAVTRDPATGQLRPEFVPDSTAGGAGDRLHPNRAGYLAMAASVDLDLFR
jgi:lysophospholipase L1-like esterase